MRQDLGQGGLPHKGFQGFGLSQGGEGGEDLGVGGLRFFVHDESV